MVRVSEAEIVKRYDVENPWWHDRQGLDRRLIGMRDRAYFAPFYELATNRHVHRAVVLMGPRRVGKSVMLKQTVRKLMDEEGIDPRHIFFASLEHPIYRGIRLDRLLELYMEANGYDDFADLWVMFDEIQYVEEWEAYLKVMVDHYPNIRFIVSGSAAAALRMKSRESGAGRFTDFLLPPLLFKEFLDFKDVPEDEMDNIIRLNEHFIDYLNYGGFPEAVLNPHIRDNPLQFIIEDIIEKVLMRDLPSLYGIENPNELNRLFSHLVYNTGQEISISKLSQDTGIPKNTLYKYMEYLEAAFLIHRLYRVDQHGKRPQRETSFKIYITNPSLMTASFGPVTDEDERMGLMAETAVMAQLIHSDHVHRFYYARWKEGEIDLVNVTSTGDIISATEIKWSDKISSSNDELKNIIKTSAKVDLGRIQILSKSTYKNIRINELSILCAPIAKWCIALGAVFVDQDLAQGIRPRRLLEDS